MLRGDIVYLDLVWLACRWQYLDMRAPLVLCTWSMILVSAENLFRICPRGVTSKNLRKKTFHQTSRGWSPFWHLSEEDEKQQDADGKQTSNRAGLWGATWWGREWSCSAGCGAGSRPKKDPGTPQWARWWDIERFLQRTRWWRPNSRGRPVVTATHKSIQQDCFSANLQETPIIWFSYEP